MAAATAAAHRTSSGCPSDYYIAGETHAACKLVQKESRINLHSGMKLVTPCTSALILLLQFNPDRVGKTTRLKSVWDETRRNGS